MLYLCEFCAKTFSYIKNLQRHLINHTKIAFKCCLCAKPFKRRDLKKAHERKCVGKIEKPTTFVCTQCQKVFPKRWLLNKHLTTHSSPTFECLKCDKKFKTQNPRNLHLMKCKGKCTICGKLMKPNHRCKPALKINTQSKAINTKHQIKPEEKPKLSKLKYSCLKCQKRFLNKDTRNLHQNDCNTRHLCKECNRSFMRSFDMKRHSCQRNKRPQKAIRYYRCKKCPKRFDSRSDLYYHFIKKHTQTGKGYHDMPWNQNSAPWLTDGVLTDKPLKKIYMKYKHLILRSVYAETPISCNYNFPVRNNFTLAELMNFAQVIYEKQVQTFKLNMAFGYILRHKVTGELRYFIAFDNEPIFDKPIYISKASDLLRLKRKLSRLDINEYIFNMRIDTSWTPYLITNLTFFIQNTGFTLGNALELPQFLVDKKSIIGLTKSYKGNHTFSDNLCLFRALTIHRHPQKWRSGDHEEFEREVYHYYQEFRRQSNEEDLPSDPMDYEGFGLELLPNFEKTFRVNCNLFELSEDNAAYPIFKSTCRYPDTMNLNLWQHHVSLVTKFSSYAQKFVCRSCRRHFKSACNWRKHEGRCKSKTRVKFLGGFYNYKNSLFDELEEFGLMVDPEDRFCQHFCCFDMESYLEKIEGDCTQKLEWLEKHMPISVSLSSNLPGYEKGRCIINENPDELVQEMVEYLLQIRDKYQTITEEKYGHILSKLEDLIKQWSNTDAEDEQTVYDEEDKVKTKETFQERVGKIMYTKLSTLRKKLKTYMSQLICVGFNNAR